MKYSSGNEICQSKRKIAGFEELLMEISALFINLPIDSIDNVIEDTQRRICLCLGIDLSALWQWSDKDSQILTITHLYGPSDGPELPVGIDGSKTFPWIYDKLMSGETLAFSNDDLPEQAEIDIATRRSFQVESSVAIPLSAGDKSPLGIISFDSLHEKRVWSTREVRRLKLVAEIFTNALTRKSTERGLIESEERLSMAAESAEAGLWELDCNTNTFWATDQARKLFDYATEEKICMVRFEKSIFHEDLETVKQALADSFNNKDNLNIEYRILSDVDSLRWICSKGQPYFHNDGSPNRMLGISVDITERKLMEETLKQNLAEINLLKEQIEQENIYLREDLRTEQGFEHVIGASKPFVTVMTSAKQVAPTTATVLLLGETGTGKGVMANAIYQMSERSKKPFVTVNCAALPPNLIESELFGREKGAYTGANFKQAGRFEVANKGTIFLDEIGEMPLEMQTKLLRVLQDGEFELLGSSKTFSVDVRVIAATSRNLKDDVKEGRFREDLFYRLNVFPISIPPLRKRRDDIAPLAQHFIEKYSRKFGKEIDSIPKRTLDKMLNYPWPGNIRELEHLVERSLIVTTGNSLAVNEQLLLLDPDFTDSQKTQDLQSNERDHIVKVLELTNWRIEGTEGAATILGINPSTLRFRLKKLGIKRPT